jgi:signal transduction histidine kinase
MPQWRSQVMDLALASTRAPFSMPSFREHYRVIRRTLGFVVVLVTLGTGFAWNVDAAHVVLPAVAGLGVASLLHDLFLPKVSWRSMAVFDAIAYTGVLVLIELPEPIAFVVMSQVLICFLTVPARAALRTTAFLLALGWAGYAGIAYLDVQIYQPGERLFLSVLASLMAMVPSCWAMLIAGAEMRTQRARTDQLLTEKDELLADKDRFLATVSHELRTPLTVVHGLATLLESADLDDAERQDLMRAMTRESGDVAAIVEDLLVLARADGGMVSIRPQSLEIRRLVEQVGHSQRPRRPGSRLRGHRGGRPDPGAAGGSESGRQRPAVRR